MNRISMIQSYLNINRDLEKTIMFDCMRDSFSLYGVFGERRHVWTLVEMFGLDYLLVNPCGAVVKLNLSVECFIVSLINLLMFAFAEREIDTTDTAKAVAQVEELKPQPRAASVHAFKPLLKVYVA